MTSILIVKLGATGDVVRTTSLLHRLGSEIVWITEAKNRSLLSGLSDRLRCFSWEEKHLILDITYDLVINLEDTLEVARYLKGIKHKQWFGAYANDAGILTYTEDSHSWFDMSLISAYGREEADRLKFRNRSTYQELIFGGLEFVFHGEEYCLPTPIETRLRGDVALAAEAGPVWPMKKWAYYPQLKERLERHELVVNVLPKRDSLLEHLGDVANHKCLVGGDSLPMHFALGTRTPCVTLFTCTSPWEIYEYGVQKKIVSPLLAEFFYKRGYDARAVTTISVDEVFQAVMDQLEGAAESNRAAVRT
jgi:ADP-heptose:LPS heptosyltransferase